MTPHLSMFDNSWYTAGRSRLVRALWFFFGLPLLRCSVMPWSWVRVLLLRLFGARIGQGVVIKPGARIKYPWLLAVGDHAWIGEDAWIDNLAPVVLGRDVCISQGAYLCTGNHDWSDPAFRLVVAGITLDNGAWVGAHAVVCPGVMMGEGAVAAAGSVVARHIPPSEVHSGNPAKFVRRRTIRDALPVDEPVFPA